MSGSTYCGSFEWLRVSKARGASTQAASQIGSRAAASRRVAQVARQRDSPAHAGTIHGNAATGTIGR